MATYVVANVGDQQQQDGSELTPYVGFQGLIAVQALAKPGDTILIRGPLEYGVVRWAAHGAPDAPIVIKPHPDGGQLDGHYRWPRGAAAWIGVDVAGDATEGVHTPLLRIAGDHTHWQVPILRSRGRLVQLGGDKSRPTVGARVQHTRIEGAMTAMIDIRYARGCAVVDNDISEGSAYYPQRGGDRELDEDNVAGCIKTIQATDTTIEGNRIKHHYGNVVTPSRGSDGVLVRNNEIHDCNGTFVYVHWATRVTVEDNVSWYSPAWGGSGFGTHSAYVVNNEHEFLTEGNQAGNVKFLRNIALGTSYGLAVWGNEGEEVLVDGIEATDNSFINCTKAALRTQRNARYRGFVLRRNLLAAPVEGQLTELLSSAPLDMDESNRLVVGGPVTATRAGSAAEVRELAQLLRLASVPRPVGPDRAAWRAWLAEADELIPQLQEFFERGKALVG